MSEIQEIDFSDLSLDNLEEQEERSFIEVEEGS